MRKCFVFLLMLCANSAFSQVNDTFTDGNFNSSPEWKGDVAAFTVNSAKQLQTIQNAASQTFSLSTSNVLSVNAKWEFFIQLNFDPSANNQARTYLISDSENLKGALNGYFIQIGETGSTDSYDLYRQSGLTVTRIIDGSARTRIAANQLIARVLVTRTENGIWELQTDIKGGTDFTSEGTVTDNTFTSSSWMGVYCKYTTTNSDKFIFDDFKSETLVADITGPKLLSATVVDSITIDALFDEPLDTLSAKTRTNFILSSGYNNPTTISGTADASRYRLRFSKGFNTGNYILKASNIKDLNSNSISINNSVPFSYVKPYIAAKNDLVINEIFADPSPQIDLPSVEFIELLNTTDHSINLKGWKYSDASTTITLSGDTIKAGQLLILSAKADTAEFKRFGKVLGIAPWPSLNNSGDILKLTSPENKIIDSVAYNDTWYREPSKKLGGWTLERVDAACSCLGLFNWKPAIDTTGGTPGRQNSVHYANYDQLPLTADGIQQLSDSTIKVTFNKHIDASTALATKFKLNNLSGNFSSISLDQEYQQATLVHESKYKPGTLYSLSISGLTDCSGRAMTEQLLSFQTPALPLVPAPAPARLDTAKIYITEILADPSPEFKLPLVEFVELYNPGKDTVDLDGWILNDPVTKSAIRKTKIFPKEYLILCPAADTLSYKPFGKTAGLTPWPSLNNSSDQIALRSFKNRLVDSVSYADTWYKDTAKKSGGWSLEKIAIQRTNDFYSWTSSENPSGGTPGVSNSVAISGNLNSILTIDSVSVTSDSTLRVTLNMIPDTAYIKPSYFNLNFGGHPQKVQLSTTYKTIDLKFSASFQEDTQYLLSVDSLRTSAGVSVDPVANQKSFTIPSAIEEDYPVIITEIFADPSPQIGLPDTEFIEFFNYSDKNVNLKGLTFEDATGSKHIFKWGTIPAREYLIVCPQKDTLNYKPFGRVLGISTWPSLNNDKDILILRNNKGKEFHRLAYNNTWYKDKEKMAGGWSLEMIDPETICSGSQNWLASINNSGGTPGKQNSVYKIYNTNEALKIIDLTFVDSLTLQLRFNRSVDSTSASVRQNYTLNNGLGLPASALAIGPDFDQVLLKFSSSIARGNRYIVKCTNLTDCAGNVISTAANSADFFYPETITKNDIIINEVLFNPRPGGVDFVEIYNNSDKILDLKDLSLGTISANNSYSGHPITLSQLLIQPKTYLCLTSDPDDIKQKYSAVNPDAFVNMVLSAFNDKEGTIILQSNKGLVDQLSYTEKMHFPLIKNPEGVSLERRSFTRPTNEPGNFLSAAASAGYATPGYKNSQHAEDISNGSDEVLFSSKTFSPDNDGFEDQLTLNYNFPEAGMVANSSIYNDKGILIRKLTKNMTLGQTGSITWDGLTETNELCGVGIYVLYLEVFNLDGTTRRYRKNCVLAAKLN